MTAKPKLSPVPAMAVCMSFPLELETAVGCVLLVRKPGWVPLSPAISPQWRVQSLPVSSRVRVMAKSLCWTRVGRHSLKTMRLFPMTQMEESLIKSARRRPTGTTPSIPFAILLLILICLPEFSLAQRIAAPMHWITRRENLCGNFRPMDGYEPFLHAILMKMDRTKFW